VKQALAKPFYCYVYSLPISALTIFYAWLPLFLLQVRGNPDPTQSYLLAEGQCFGFHFQRTDTARDFYRKI